MADEDIESGGQTDDAGDTDTDADEAPADAGERQTAAEGGDKADRPSRPERRKAKMREAAIARETAEREAAEWRARHQQTEARLAEIQARLDERERSTQTQGKAEQRKQKVADLRARALSHLQLSAQSKDPATAKAEWDRHQELQDEANQLLFEGRLEEREEKLRGEFRGAIPNQEVMAERNYFQTKYPWLETNRTAQRAADGRYEDLVAAGRPPNRATLEEAITYVARAFKLGGNGQSPSSVSRSAYVGRGQADGETDDAGGAGGSMTVDDVRNNLAYKRMALSAYPQLEGDQAIARWLKDVGGKLRQGA